jgi:pimeloyl-ACP methyl ester carboxylesterase
MRWCLVVAACSLASFTAHAAEKPGVVFVVGGVGGFDIIGPAAQRALPKAGVPHEVRDFVWTHGKGQLIRDLQDTDHLTAKAVELAAEVRKVRAADPDRPIYLVGHSGGAALVLLTAERLPAESLEHIVLLSAAVSPRRDLRPALRACRHELISFNSELDHFWLDIGTRWFGTADGEREPSAGLGGFEKPEGLDEEGRRLYARLVQIKWKPEMALNGYRGFHHSTSTASFQARYVAPWLIPSP